MKMYTPTISDCFKCEVDLDSSIKVASYVRAHRVLWAIESWLHMDCGTPRTVKNLMRADETARQVKAFGV